MRKDDIGELLDEVNGNIALIKAKHIKASSDESIKEILKPKVKSVLEHLRSCLDYCAHDIYDMIYKPNDGLTEGERSKLNVYFPYGNTINNFHSSLGRSGFKDLKNKNNQVYLLLTSIQPFHCNNKWLVDLCKTTNDIKHNELIKQDRKDKKTLRMNNVNIIAGLENIENLYLSGNTINGIRQKNDLVFKRGKLLSSIDGEKMDITIINWTKFTFASSDTGVLELLETSYKNISDFSMALYNILDL